MSIKWVVHDGKDFTRALIYGQPFSRWLKAFQYAESQFAKDGKERFIYRVEMTFDESYAGPDAPLLAKQRRRMGSLQRGD